MATDTPLVERLRGLIERLEKLEGPDQSLDAEICIALQYGGSNSEGAQNVRTEPDWEGDLLFEIGEADCCNPIPELTALIDEAVALVERVLPGWRHAYEKRTSGTILAWVTEEDDAPCIPAIGATPAIALLIATLRALSQEQRRPEAHGPPRASSPRSSLPPQ